MDYKTADRLVELRKKNRYSQEDLAEKLGVTRQAVSNWERAEALPDTENLIALASLYKITLDEVVHGDKPRVSETAVEKSGKLKPVQGNNMKPVPSVFIITRLVNLIIGTALLGIGILIVGLSFAFSYDAALALLVTGAAIAFSGLVEAIIGLSFHAVVKKGANRLERLKDNGIKFQVETIELKLTPGFHTGRRVAGRLECSYTNHQGKTCLVRSGLFMTHRNSTYNAFVYVNSNDPTDYAVEVFIQQGHDKDIYDYR